MLLSDKDTNLTLNNDSYFSKFKIQNSKFRIEAGAV